LNYPSEYLANFVIIGVMNLYIEDKFKVKNSSLTNIAQNLTIVANKFKFSSSSTIRYHTNLNLKVWDTFNISGLFTPNDPMFALENSDPTVMIYAGNVTDEAEPEENKLLIREEDDPPEDLDFVIHETSVIRGGSILIFSKRNLTLNGTIENISEDNEGESTIIGSCKLSKTNLNYRI